jgi:hypothetical protein
MRYVDTLPGKEALTLKPLAITFCGLLLGYFAQPAAAASFLSTLTHNVSITSSVTLGDVNPYGVARVPVTMGNLVGGQVLVSNFNNAGNFQGTGTTIVQVAFNGSKTLFAHIPVNQPGCIGGVGLTTALVAFRNGWVLVGSLPAPTGSSSSMQPGCLIVLNANGQVVETFSSGDILGPWDLTVWDDLSNAVLFFTTVLNGTVANDFNLHHDGNVVRLTLSIKPSSNNPADFAVTSDTIIAHGFVEQSSASALIVGPTGLGYVPDPGGADGTLYVADTFANRIAAIPNAKTTMVSAGTGTTVSQGGALNGPLGLCIAPNGNILTANGGDGNLVETTPGGSQVFVKFVDLTNTGAGALFGIAITREMNGVLYVNDVNNTLNVIF